MNDLDFVMEMVEQDLAYETLDVNTGQMRITGLNDAINTRQQIVDHKVKLGKAKRVGPKNNKAISSAVRDLDTQARKSARKSGGSMIIGRFGPVPGTVRTSREYRDWNTNPKSQGIMQPSRQSTYKDSRVGR